MSIRGAIRRGYAILAVVGIAALAIVLLPEGVARFLGLDDRLGGSFWWQCWPS